MSFLKGQYERGERSSWAIELKKEEKVIGAIDFVEMDSINQNGMVGYILNRHYWRQGIISEALKKVLEVGFQELGLHRIEARCIKDNIGSSKVMEKCGFHYEGCFRDKNFKDSKYYDVVYYAILEDDYFSQNM